MNNTQCFQYLFTVRRFIVHLVSCNVRSSVFVNYSFMMVVGDESQQLTGLLRNLRNAYTD